MNDGRRLLQVIAKRIRTGKKIVGNGMKRVIIPEHKIPQHGIGYRLVPDVYRQYGPNIGVNHKTGQGSQEQFAVITVRSAAFGMGYGHNVINPVIPGSQGTEFFFQAANESGR
jgi:hypothetical protein